MNRRDAEDLFPGLGEKEGELLPAIAREALDAYFEGRPPRRESWGALKDIRAGAFVTLEKGGRLRGCIGRMESRDSLPETVSRMALAAALEDPRFPPLAAEEMRGLCLEVTVLGPLMPLSGPGGLRIGEDGVLIAYKGRTGVLLPQVAVDYGWDAETFVNQVCRKAGLPEGAWMEPGAALYSFFGKVFSSG